MPRPNRAPSFQFYPADWLADPAIHAMTFDQRGRYLQALCLSCQTQTPGVATEDQWRQWMELSPDQWVVQRQRFASAFKASRSKWTQQRLHSDRKMQRTRYEQSRKGAAVTNEKRWGSVAQRPDSDRKSVTPSSSSSSSSSVGASTSLVPEGTGDAVFGHAVSPRLLKAFGLGLLREMASAHPRRDVLSIAAKVLDDPSVRRPASAFRNWCRIADERNLDRKPWDPASWGREDAVAAS